MNVIEPPMRRVAPVVKPRLGFVGVGWIGRHRLEALARSGLVDVAYVADPVPELIAAARQAAPAAAACRDLEELLAHRPDGVVIATPSALHAEQAIRALEEGCAVFCQKPLARSGEETRRVVAAARAADRRLGVDLSYRHVRGLHEIRRRLQAGEIGDVYAADLVFHNAYGPDKPWFRDPVLSGGGCVIDLGIHLVDAALWVLGFPEVAGVTSRLFAGGRPLAEAGLAVEDYAVARLDLAGGATVTLACSWHLPAGRDAVIGATFYGTRGGLSLQNVDGSFYDFQAELYRGTAREVLVAPPDDWGGRAAVAWAERLGDDARFDPEVESTIAVAEVLDRIYAAGGRLLEQENQ